MTVTTEKLLTADDLLHLCSQGVRGEIRCGCGESGRRNVRVDGRAVAHSISYPAGLRVAWRGRGTAGRVDICLLHRLRLSGTLPNGVSMRTIIALSLKA